MASEVSVLFVCLGNICRSPTAEGIFAHLVLEAGLAESIAIDSAGTGAWHKGERADRRARETAKRRGIELLSRARAVHADNFERFDYIVAMDRSNRDNLLNLAPQQHADKIVMMRSFDSTAEPDAEVPDPYYGGDRGFENVFDLVTRACEGLLAEIKTRLRA